MSQPMDGKRQAILYIGGNARQISAIRAAQDLGLFVVLTDRAPDAAARPYADRFEAIDATDVGAILGLARELDRTLNIVGVHGIADYAFAAVGAVAAMLNLDLNHPDVYRLCADKAACRDRLAGNGVAIARGVHLEDPTKDGDTIDQAVCGFQFPVVVKPARSGSGQGVVTVRTANPQALAAAVAEARNYADAAVIEELAVGRHLNVDGLFIGGTLHPVAITERTFIDDDHHVASFGVQPADLPSARFDALYAVTEQAGQALGFSQGPVTCDIVLTKDGPVVLEFSPHYLSLSTNAARDDGASIKAWFAYLSGEADWQRHLDDEPRGIAAYYYLYLGAAPAAEQLATVETLTRDQSVIGVEIETAPPITPGATPGICAVVSLWADDRAVLEASIRAIPTIANRTVDTLEQVRA